MLLMYCDRVVQFRIDFGKFALYVVELLIFIFRHTTTSSLKIHLSSEQLLKYKLRQ